jgi:HAD superfamily hydrolase (TIGR01509 family)
MPPRLPRLDYGARMRSSTRLHGAGAVIFDLDGVLLESEQVWSAAKRDVSLKHGGRWSAAAETDMLGMNSAEWSRYMGDQLAVQLGPVEISTAVAESVASRYRERLPLIDGADTALRALAGRALGLASSSNRATIDLVLELTGWARLFAVTTSSEEVRAGKPEPDVYLEAARRLEVDPRSCVAVEDSGVGIRSAHAAGLTVIAIPNAVYPPDAEDLRRAEAVLASIAELPAAIGERRNR